MHIIGEVWPNQYTLLDILIHLLRISPHWDAWLLLDNGFWSFPPSRSQPCESPFAPNSEVTTCHTQATRYFSILDVLPHSGFARHCPLLNERWQKLWSQKFQTTTPQFSQLEVHGELHIYIYDRPTTSCVVLSSSMHAVASASTRARIHAWQVMQPSKLGMRQ